MDTTRPCHWMTAVSSTGDVCLNERVFAGLVLLGQPVVLRLVILKMDDLHRKSGSEIPMCYMTKTAQWCLISDQTSRRFCSHTFSLEVSQVLRSAPWVHTRVSHRRTSEALGQSATLGEPPGRRRPTGLAQSHPLGDAPRDPPPRES